MLTKIDLASLESLIRRMGADIYTLPKVVKSDLIEEVAVKTQRDISSNARTMHKNGYQISQTDSESIAAACNIERYYSGNDDPYAIINFNGSKGKSGTLYTKKYYEPRDIHPIRKNNRWYMSREHGLIKNGKRRVAEIAFLNEYGVPKNRNQSARGFISKGMESGLDRAYNNLVMILGDYLERGIGSAAMQ